MRTKEDILTSLLKGEEVRILDPEVIRRTLADLVELGFEIRDELKKRGSLRQEMLDYINSQVPPPNFAQLTERFLKLLLEGKG